MRSRRSQFETACRVAAFAVLGWLLGGAFFPSTSRNTDRASSTDVASRLERWTHAPPTTALQGAFATVPDAWVVDWLAALRHSNHRVTWSGSPPATMIAMEALADPEGGVRIDIAAPNGAEVVVRDEGSVIDSARVNAFGASVVTPVVIGDVSATVGAQLATMPPPDSLALRAVVVIGGASWEGKFIVTALEERGWPVIARFSVAPNVEVTQGAALALDTARVSAVIAIDTLIQSQGAMVERFVRSGGGLILAGTASQTRALRSIAPGLLGTRTRPTLLPTDSVRLGSTGFYPVSSLNSGGVPIDRRADGIALAARRIGAGRVLQLGYDDSWRWRMAGGTGSERAHREWWSRMIGAVAYVAAPETRHVSGVASAAPLAYMVDRLGPSQPSGTGGTSRGPVDKRILLGAIVSLLILEWGSRRLRGLR